MVKRYPRNCPSCGLIVFHSSVGSRSHCRNDKCRKCSDKNKTRARNGKLNGKWKGYEGISLSYFNDIKNRTKKINREFNITIEDMWNQFIKQNKKCIYTGVELQLPKRNRAGYFGTASLDRIDSSKGYTKENIQWVHKDINWMKQDFDENYFVNMCDLVSNHTKLDKVTPTDIFIKENELA